MIREPDARSHDDRAFHQRHEEALAELFGRGARAVRQGRAREGRGHRDRRDKVRERVAARHARLRADRAEILDEAARSTRGGRALRRRAWRRAAPGAVHRQGRARLVARGQRRLDERRAARPGRSRGRGPERLGSSRSGGSSRSTRSGNEANADYEAYRGTRADEGRPPLRQRPPTPYTPPPTPAGKVNVTDPDSRNVKTPRGWVQGYNAQAVCNERQIVIAAEVTGSTRPTSATSNRCSRRPSASSEPRASRRRRR